jgi:hypothetical protein
MRVSHVLQALKSIKGIFYKKSQLQKNSSTGGVKGQAGDFQNFICFSSVPKGSSPLHI